MQGFRLPTRWIDSRTCSCTTRATDTRVSTRHLEKTEEGIPPGDLALISAEHFGAAVDCALTHRRGGCSFPLKPREGADVGGSCKQMCHAPTRQEL